MALLRALKLPCLALIALLFVRADSQCAQPGREYDIKAAMVFNFAQFVDWPTNAFAATNAPFVIGILGADPFGKALDELIKGENVHGHPMEVLRLRTIEETTQCHILFVARSEQANWPRIRRYLARAPVLTVSDIDRFASRGGMIGLVMDENKVRFRINARAAEAANLALSSKLLRLAEITETTEN